MMPIVWKVRVHRYKYAVIYVHIDGLVQGCSNSIADAMELLHSCTKPSKYIYTSLNKTSWME